MKGTHLGEFEELVLLAVAALHGNAYAVTVKGEIEERASRKVNISAVHSSLYRLEEKGFLESSVGGATNKRGGKSKRLFKVTAYGFKSLKEAQSLRQSFWNIIPQLSTQE
ncbi:PadR family transcriptional regulator [Roseivirga pacifica]|uniref:Transcriptional regulator PadR-like family protein n=1 Tax=Roseivirga pacifica TaxID=1267423 RepID=A0A1I0RAN3_9BACT|nr:helix-turn-helix transcriptional regulator [Roseivirga pacifica]RKQ49299.1 PadR family transcriptional regulator [Roseivirga pacifica]SEW37769.1 Transcriptional regulator PadR-like family protein [Roseivirga pacifica]